jgi:hypothetical protein
MLTRSGGLVKDPSGNLFLARVRAGRQQDQDPVDAGGGCILTGAGHGPLYGTADGGGTVFELAP